MKNRILSIALLLTIGLIVISCSQSSENRSSVNKSKESSVIKSENALQKADEISLNASAPNEPMQEENMTSSAAVVSKIDTIRKFIRTAELNFKVKDVYKATHKIEDLTKDFGGFVTESNLNNDIINTSTKSVSADSSVLITEYVLKTKLELRVPQNQLDSFLRSLTPLVEFINKRVVSANDIHIDLLKSQLEQLRNQSFVEETNNIKTKGISTRLATLQAQASSDAAKIDKLMILDKVEFSTVSIEIYQQSEVRYEMIANNYSNRYDPGFGTRVWSSVKTGFIVIQELFLFAIKFWGIILLGFCIYFFAMFIHKKFKRK